MHHCKRGKAQRKIVEAFKLILNDIDSNTYDNNETILWRISFFSQKEGKKLISINVSKIQMTRNKSYWLRL